MSDTLNVIDRVAVSTYEAPPRILSNPDAFANDDALGVMHDRLQRDRARSMARDQPIHSNLFAVLATHQPRGGEPKTYPRSRPPRASNAALRVPVFQDPTKTARKGKGSASGCRHTVHSFQFTASTIPSGSHIRTSRARCGAVAGFRLAATPDLCQTARKFKEIL